MINLRNNLLNHKLVSLAVITVVGASAGCTSTNLLEGERINYQSASKGNVQTLEIPPDLSQISRDNRYAIPKATGEEPNGPITASGFNAQAAKAPTTSAKPMTAVNTTKDMRIERDGAQRWLLVKQSPEVLWPKVKEFWEENGFLIAQESQATGVMETDWAENRAKIPEDFIRSAIGKVFDSLYSTGERDKFRTRLERRPDGAMEIYISHRGLEEALVGTDKSSTTWANRPNDPALEATFLARLMVNLGATKEKAKELVNAPIDLPAKAILVTLNSAPMLDVNENFDRAWRRIGLALDRVGFTVEDRDRNKGIYFVRYVDEEEVTNKKGFFTRLFGASDKEVHAKRYQILVKGEGNVSHVAVQNNDGTTDKSSSADKILKLLLEQLR